MSSDRHGGVHVVLEGRQEINNQIYFQTITTILKFLVLKISCCHFFFHSHTYPQLQGPLKCDLYGHQDFCWSYRWLFIFIALDIVSA